MGVVNDSFTNAIRYCSIAQNASYVFRASCALIFARKNVSFSAYAAYLCVYSANNGFAAMPLCTEGLNLNITYSDGTITLLNDTGVYLLGGIIVFL